MIGDAVIDLLASGAVTEVVTGALVGTRRLFAFAHDEPRLRVEPVSHTHDHAVLRGLPEFTAANSAVEVDLTGQVGAEVAGGAYIGTVGGQVDFVRGALASEGGRSIIALPARTRSGRPRIVPVVESGVVTTGRADADVVVTEYGVAHLRGRSIPERVRSMVAIAASRRSRDAPPRRGPRRRHIEERNPMTQLYVLDGGRIEVLDWRLFQPDAPPGTRRSLAVSCYLVVHPAGTLLWDTGLGDDLAGTAGRTIRTSPCSGSSGRCASS